MVAKSIVKLIDEAIVPAVALIAGKMLGVLLSIYFLNLSFTVVKSETLWILPSIHFADLAGYAKVENYSNLTMFTVAAAGTILVLVRAHFFHESHIHPRLHAKLASLNLESLIAPSYHLYHQAAIWLIFLWLSVGFLVISTLFGVTYGQIAIVAFVVAANFSWVFALDIEKEVEIAKQY